VTRLRDFLLRPPRRADGRVALLAIGLAVTGLALPETGRIGGASTLGALKAALAAGGYPLGYVTSLAENRLRTATA